MISAIASKQVATPSICEEDNLCRVTSKASRTVIAGAIELITEANSNLIMRAARR